MMELRWGEKNGFRIENPRKNIKMSAAKLAKIFKVSKITVYKTIKTYVSASLMRQERLLGKAFFCTPD